MAWSAKQRFGAALTVAGTFAVIAFALNYSWHITQRWEGMQGMSFLSFALIFGLVLLAIGGVMAFYIVMIIRKNERADRDGS